MFLTITRKHQYMPLVAPLGAAAYLIYEEPSKPDGHERFTVIWALMQEKDPNALSCLTRIRREYPALETKHGFEPVSSNPEIHTAHTSTKSQFATWTFVSKGGVWYPEDDDVARLLGMVSMSSIGSPATPQSTLRENLEFVGPPRP